MTEIKDTAKAGKHLAISLQTKHAVFLDLLAYNSTPD